MRQTDISTLGLCLLLLLGSYGCERSGNKQSPDAGLAFAMPGPIAASQQAEGDPQAGYRAVTEGTYITCGLPDSVYQKVSPQMDPGDRLPDRSGRNAELPYQFSSYTTPEGVPLVVSNCLTCHAAHFNGKLIVGLGNESLDFTEDRSESVESTGMYVSGEAEAREWRLWSDRMRAIAPYIVTDTVGLNPAINLTWALFAHHDPITLTWSDKPVLEPPSRQVLPVSTPPWWRMRKKHAMFYSGEGRGDHVRLMFLASSLCTDSVAAAETQIQRYGRDLRAYIANLTPPRYPFPVDAPLAERGQQVFEATCSRCHGTYGPAWIYPNLLVDIGTVGTDPALMEAGMSSAYGRFYRWFAQSPYGRGAELLPARGYVAPPLDGVWATAPYLHNGSVPTLAVLLESAKRPRYWRRTYNSTDYDPQTLGWRYVELPAGKAAAADPGLRKQIYDTDGAGASNAGHTFGDGLTDDDRRAVLEYIKTL